MDHETEEQHFIHLADGQEPIQQEPVKPSRIVPLEDARTKDLLERLPHPQHEKRLQEETRIHPDAPPPPRTGEVEAQPFPPKAEAKRPKPDGKTPLQVLRYGPEGEVPLAANVHVTFSQDMVPLSDLATIEAMALPLNMHPVPHSGAWRWLGTRTLAFESPGGLPMATLYTLEVPKGTRGQGGRPLEEAVRWQFQTPRLSLVQHQPGSGMAQPLRPLITMVFNQKIDAEALAPFISMRSQGQNFRFEVIGQEDPAWESTGKPLENQYPGKWLAIRPQSELPAAAEIQVAVEPGAPSAEGPLLTLEAQSFNFHTYEAFAFLGKSCGWGDHCRPQVHWQLEFNNPLDEDWIDAAIENQWIRIEPALENPSAHVFQNRLYIGGQAQPETPYTVEVDASLRDLFGQELGQKLRLEFQVGQEDPIFLGTHQTFALLNPWEKPELGIVSTNQEEMVVGVFKVDLEDWPKYIQLLAQNRRDMSTPWLERLPGRKLKAETIKVPDHGKRLRTLIDFSSALDKGMGHALVFAQPHKSYILGKKGRFSGPKVLTWIQATRIGLETFMDRKNLYCRAYDLKTGQPLEEVGLKLVPLNNPTAPIGTTFTTDNLGMATLELPEQQSNSPLMLVATKGKEQALLPESMFFRPRSSWTRTRADKQLSWFVADDRGMYKPGEAVYLKGWLREHSDESNSLPQIGGTLSGASVDVRIMGPRGNELGKATLKLNAFAGFDLTFKLPENMNLGQARFQFELHFAGRKTGYVHQVQVQEFRRPKFEVALGSEPGPFFIGDTVPATVSAKYYAGGPLRQSEVRWNVAAYESHYQPPHWPKYRFGKPSPFWRIWPENKQTDHAQFSAKTDFQGKHTLEMKFDKPKEIAPQSISLSASVSDVDRQSIDGSHQILIHPASVYLGIKPDRFFMSAGTSWQGELVAVDPDGQWLGGQQVTVQLIRQEWKRKKGQWQEIEEIQKTMDLVMGGEPERLEFPIKKPGSYLIRAEAEDQKGRSNRTDLSLWVSGGNVIGPWRDTQDEVKLSLDRDTYQPGDKATLLIQSPIAPANAHIALVKGDILESGPSQGKGHWLLELTQREQTVTIPIEEIHIPGFEIRVVITGQQQPAKGEKTASPVSFSNSVHVAVPPEHYRLRTTVEPSERELEPGGETKLKVQVTDQLGNPIPRVDLAVWVVDEAVLALTNYSLEDPLRHFFPSTPDHLRHMTNLDLLVAPSEEHFEESMTLAEAGSFRGRHAEMMAESPMPTAMLAEDSAGNDAQAKPIALRKDFNPVALFLPDVPLDRNGFTTIPVRLPDNLTRYRIIALAAGEARFGMAESVITARLPIMIRPSAPRFLNYGDQVELPVVIHNQTAKDMDIDVALRTQNLIITSSQGVRISVPAQARSEIRFHCRTDMVGTARLQVAASTGHYADAADVAFPVYTPATTEAFATYGDLQNQVIAFPVQTPEAIIPHFGGLRIDTSSTQLQALTDAVIYLHDYPYSYSEPIASRILAIATLAPVLHAFQVEELPEPQAFKQKMSTDIAELTLLQNDDGGFGYWFRGERSNPFTSLHALHALVRAQQSGWQVPQQNLDRGRDYLRIIDRYLDGRYDKRSRDTINAYSLYVRHLMGDPVQESATHLVERLENLPLEVSGWLLEMLSDRKNQAKILRLLENRVTETASSASYMTAADKKDYLILHSNRRTDAIILNALLAAAPDHDLIPKLVRELLGHRTKGHWSSTQENGFILLALGRYFQQVEDKEPNFTARAWLGRGLAYEDNFKGRQTKRSQCKIPLTYFKPDDTNKLTLQMEGEGRMFYRLGMNYAPQKLDQEPLDRGFTLTRSYSAVEKDGHVVQGEDGSWQIPAGTVVRVSLTMVAPAQRTHVALVDHLPAGLEPLNPALATVASPPQNELEPAMTRWYGPWFNFQNLRDERAEAFATYLGGGVYQYQYLARATTPGTFQVPPAKAYEMYHPETFGRSASTRVIIK